MQIVKENVLGLHQRMNVVYVMVMAYQKELAIVMVVCQTVQVNVAAQQLSMNVVYVVVRV